ncbi:unnamed protein product [Rotaria sordida]|nr:unnamed protein product [Rotaria sordida]CAF1161011.1 unnamed protein product [Rotaria sordida]CAF3923563.1 unnamed protein product [Rotaria sordida]CAF3924233.1 unnamed protein product [Rotaria sordida]
MRHFTFVVCVIASGSGLKWNLTGVTVAGNGASGHNAENLNQPRWLYIDANDILYICDYNNNRIQRWLLGATNGTTVAGQSDGSAGAGSNQLHQPGGIDFDNNGYMYVADSGNDRVQRYAPNSNNGTTVAGSAGNEGSATNELHQPISVVVDDNFNMFISDMGNKRVVKWAANTTNGTILIDGSSNGAANGQLKNPYGILLINDSSNQIYLSDQSKDYVGIWTFGAGIANTTWFTANGTDLNQPTQITMDRVA